MTNLSHSPRPLLVVVAVVLAVVLAGLIGTEFYARGHAAGLVAEAVQCEVHDTAEVSFGAARPVLWQYLGGHYTEVSVRTAGNRVRSAVGMRVDVHIHDVHVQRGPAAKGTVGSLDGSITWSTAGIKQSIQRAAPILGAAVTGEIRTNPGAGTIELNGPLDKVTLKPLIIENGLALQIVGLSALGHSLDTATVQRSLDDLTATATRNYPLGIHADSVQVTDTGVLAMFSSRNATIPSGTDGSHPCFANL